VRILSVSKSFSLRFLKDKSVSLQAHKQQHSITIHQQTTANKTTKKVQIQIIPLRVLMLSLSQLLLQLLHLLLQEHILIFESLQLLINARLISNSPHNLALL